MKQPPQTVQLRSVQKPLEAEPTLSDQRFLRKWTDGLYGIMVEDIAMPVIDDMQRTYPHDVRAYDEFGQFVYAPILKHSLALVLTDLARSANESPQPIDVEELARHAHGGDFDEFQSNTGVTSGGEQLLAMERVAYHLGCLPLVRDGVDMYWRDTMVTIDAVEAQEHPA